MSTRKPIRDGLLARRARFGGALTLGVIAPATPVYFCSTAPSSTLAWLTTFGFSLGVGRSWRRRRKSGPRP